MSISMKDALESINSFNSDRDNITLNEYVLDMMVVDQCREYAIDIPPYLINEMKRYIVNHWYDVDRKREFRFRNFRDWVGNYVRNKMEEHCARF